MISFIIKTLLIGWIIIELITLVFMVKKAFNYARNFKAKQEQYSGSVSPVVGLIGGGVK